MRSEAGEIGGAAFEEGSEGFGAFGGAEPFVEMPQLEIHDAASVFRLSLLEEGFGDRECSRGERGEFSGGGEGR